MSVLAIEPSFSVYRLTYLQTNVHTSFLLDFLIIYRLASPNFTTPNTPTCSLIFLPLFLILLSSPAPPHSVPLAYDHPQHPRPICYRIRAVPYLLAEVALKANIDALWVSQWG